MLLLLGGQYFLAANCGGVGARCCGITAPLVVLTSEKPVAPDCAVSTADVVTTPAGRLQVLVAASQNSNFIEPILLVVAVEKFAV